jgi:hypothetical protein
MGMKITSDDLLDIAVIFVRRYACIQLTYAVPGKIGVCITVSDVFSTIDFHHCQFFRSSPFFQDIKTTVFELESGDQLINALVV